MPILSNLKHELFAKALAAGKSQFEAHGIAGFKAHTGNASALARDERIIARVTELLELRTEIDRQAIEKAADSLAIDKRWIMAKLVENVERSMQNRPVLDADGEPIGDYRYDGNVANRALELLGKEFHMFIDRKEIGGPGEFDGLSEDDLRDFVQREAAELGIEIAGVKTLN